MKYLKVYTDFDKSIELLSDAERGRLFTAMLEYAKQGTEPDLRGNERFVWPTAKQNIDRQESSYNNKVVGAEKAREAKASSDIKGNQNDNSDIRKKELISTQDKEKDKDKDKDKEREKKIFTPPTLAEVKAYCKERRNNVNPKRFVAWYNAYGWQRNGQPVEDWKALIQTWEDDEPYQDGEPKKSKYDSIYAKVQIN